LGAAGAALLMGVLWALWHVIPYIQAGRPSDWIVWQCANSVGLRALIVWLYLEAGRSVFVVIVFHAMIDVSDYLFPNYGSHSDPFVASVVTWITVLILMFARRR
jgi:hypothetical protein